MGFQRRAMGNAPKSLSGSNSYTVLSVADPVSSAGGFNSEGQPPASRVSELKGWAVVSEWHAANRPHCSLGYEPNYLVALLAFSINYPTFRSS
jgi:hypothetical protein